MEDYNTEQLVLKRLEDSENKLIMSRKEKFIANKYDLFKQMEEK
jgi:hypothetical protein